MQSLVRHPCTGHTLCWRRGIHDEGYTIYEKPNQNTPKKQAIFYDGKIRADVLQLPTPRPHVEQWSAQA